MIRSDLLNDSPLRRKTETRGCFSVYEYEHDVSVNEYSAMMAYFASQMNVRKRQVIAKLENSAVILQAGAMQMMMGAVESTTDLKGAGDFFKKIVGSTVTGETAIKPRYSGNGAVALEPTYRYVILEDLAEWDGKLIIEDGMFLACEDTIELSVAARNTVSSALLGGEGLFNTRLSGKGIVALESRVPREELITVELKDDVLKIDGVFMHRGRNLNTNDKIVLNNVINMAKELHMAVLCEGVETREQVDFLKEAGCDVIQGFYFGKPMPENEFEDFIEKNA